jgi:NADH-quinone oxidoreductase subunit J
MTFGQWISEPANWVFLALALPTALAGFKVVTTRNLVHAALFLVVTLAGTAGLFLLLSAEFVAWTLVLVYIGAVIVLFLFGIMITRAPMGSDVGMDHTRRTPAALVALILFVVLAWGSVTAFGVTTIPAGEGVPTSVLGDSLLGRFVIPFEVVSFLLLAALIGAITIARRDTTPLEEEERTLT